MRYVFILILLCGCSANMHKRLAKHHIEKARQKGAQIDVETTVEYDTVEIESVKDSLIYKKEVDTVTLKANCDSLLSGNPQAIINIQKTVCPEVEESITLKIPITVNDSTYYIDAILLLSAQGGNLSAKLYNKPAKVAYVKTVSNTTSIPIQSRIPWWVYVIGVLLLVFALRRR